MRPLSPRGRRGACMCHRKWLGVGLRLAPSQIPAGTYQENTEPGETGDIMAIEHPAAFRIDRRSRGSSGRGGNNPLLFPSLTQWYKI